MALTDANGGGLSAADVAAVVGSNGGGFGGFGNDGAWWLIILFLFAMNGNWGGYGNGGGYAQMPMYYGMAQGDVQRGFDQSAIMGGINGLTSAVSSGFANAEVSRCNGMTNILQALNTNQAATTASMNSLAMGLQNCCCDNRAGLADLKYAVATENCADRAAVSDGIRDVIAQDVTSTNALLTAITSGIQSIKDQLCQDKIDAKNDEISNLRTQLNMVNLAQSQTAQTASILADNAAQTAMLRQALNPTPIPAYVVQNPGCCNPVGYGCGCGVVA